MSKGSGRAMRQPTMVFHGEINKENGEKDELANHSCGRR